MDLLSSYQQDLVRLLQTISTALADIPSLVNEASSSTTLKTTTTTTTSTGLSLRERRKKLFSQLERDIEETEEILGQMDLEIRGLAQVQRLEFLQKWKSWQNDVVTYRKEFRRLLALAEHADSRMALLDDQDVAPELKVTSQDQLARLLQSTKRLEHSSKTLDDSHTVAIESESIGASILRELGHQREQIVGAHHVLQTTDRGITRSRRIIRDMSRRLLANKMVLYGVVVCLVLIILLILYAKFK